MRASAAGRFAKAACFSLFVTASVVFMFGAPSDAQVRRSAVIPPVAGSGIFKDGGVLRYGAAQFFGSPTATHLAAPIVAMAVMPDGEGYWLVGADGGVLTYGDARCFGSAGAAGLYAPIVAMAATPDGRGYWLVAADGGVFTF